MMRMALITVNAVVHIPADIRVTEIVRVPSPMANRALEDRVIRGINMAGSTHAVGPAMIHGEKGMGERCPQPSCGRMTRRTSRREPCRDVVRIRCGLVNRLMATVAIYRQRREVAVHVAARAGNR